MITTLDKTRLKDLMEFRTITNCTADGVRHLEPDMTDWALCKGSIEYGTMNTIVIKGGQRISINIKGFTNIKLKNNDEIKLKSDDTFYRVEAILQRPNKLGGLYIYGLSEV